MQGLLLFVYLLSFFSHHPLSDRPSLSICLVVGSFVAVAAIYSTYCILQWRVAEVCQRLEHDFEILGVAAIEDRLQVIPST